MADYSYRDLHGMRDDAIRRVQEMQRQAMAVTEAERFEERHHNQSQSVQESPRVTPSPTVQNPVAGVRDKRTHYVPPPRNDNHRNNSKLQINEILENKELSEELLLLAIAALLLSDNCDTILVLAIMYILSN